MRETEQFFQLWLDLQKVRIRTRKVAFMHVYKICVHTNIQTLCSGVSTIRPAVLLTTTTKHILYAHTHAHTHTHRERETTRTHAHTHRQTDRQTDRQQTDNTPAHTRTHARMHTHTHTHTH